MKKRSLLKWAIAVAVLLVFLPILTTVTLLRSYPESEATAEELAVLTTKDTPLVAHIRPSHYRITWIEKSRVEGIIFWLNTEGINEPLYFDGSSTIGEADLRDDRFKNTVQPRCEIRLANDESGPTRHVVYPRVLYFDGVANFRDIGGYRTRGGRVVKWKQVYRSSALTSPSAADLVLMDQIGLATVIDLRTEAEVLEGPDRLPSGVEYIRFPIYDEGAEPRPFGAMVKHESLTEVWQRFYDDTLLRRHGRRFGELLRLIAKTDGPVLIHCTAGKDRAGLAIALLMIALGVPQETVVSDYSLSNLFYNDNLHYTEHAIESHRIASIVFGMKASQLHQFLSADPRVMRSSIDSLERDYGDIGSYLRLCLGLDDVTIGALKQKLLD